MEPASECRWLFSLLDGGDGQSFAARRIRVDVVFGCVRRSRRGHQDTSLASLTEAKQSLSGAFLFIPVGCLCNKPILGASFRSSSLASLPTHRKIYGEVKTVSPVVFRYGVRGIFTHANKWVHADRAGWTGKDKNNRIVGWQNDAHLAPC